MGTVDRALRAVIGSVLIALAATGTVGAWGYVGLIPLATAAISRCPLYLPLGISTCAKPK
jgi:hypothetical protein